MTANRLAPIVTLLLAVLLFTFHHGEAIICYQCNSEYDPRCGDPFDPYSLGTVNCSFQPRLEHLNHLEPSLCRKISQRVYGKERVVRGCGYIMDERDNAECILRTGTHDVRAVYCSCTGDLCNSAESRTPSVLLPLASLLAIVTVPNSPAIRGHLLCLN
ncbi:hypothetical protein KM043_015858 [Ampulex compressa]|nr:hypothetical protein KM043_015858 [Ampulex compressa]